MSETILRKVLTRGVAAIYPDPAELEKALTARPQDYSFYLGIDPTAPALHLGHVIPVRKLEQLRQLGCRVTLLIGDFTATIGDPTDKSAVRKVLTPQEVQRNAADYLKLLGPVLDINNSENPVTVRTNSEWLAGMPLADFLKLAQNTTVQRLIERDMFQERLKDGKPIYVHEFMYPLLQGYDSVALATDGEVGGNDQTFNMLMGRELTEKLLQKNKFVITTKLLTDPTGKKMGKSEGNMVAVNAKGSEMFGAIMSWPDEVVATAFELLTDVEQIPDLEPRDLKAALAREVITIFHNSEEAQKASAEFDRVFKDKGLPDEVLEVVIAEYSLPALDLLVKAGLAESRSEARRIITQGGMSLDEEVITDPESVLEIKKGAILRRGKRQFVKII